MQIFRRWCIAITVAGELITIACRIAAGAPATEVLNPDTHVLIRMHHFFWAVPFLVAAGVIWKREGVRQRLLGLSAGLILSDLIHHFVVLPLWVGNTGWHWP